MMHFIEAWPGKRLGFAGNETHKAETHKPTKELWIPAGAGMTSPGSRALITQHEGHEHARGLDGLEVVGHAGVEEHEVVGAQLVPCLGGADGEAATEDVNDGFSFGAVLI